jgi:4-hydroxy-tetrahydrodipicolinate reductase
MVYNAIPKVLNADPGLATMKDLPVPSAAVEDLRKYVKL